MLAVTVSGDVTTCHAALRCVAVRYNSGRFDVMQRGIARIREDMASYGSIRFNTT